MDIFQKYKRSIQLIGLVFILLLGCGLPGAATETAPLPPETQSGTEETSPTATEAGAPAEPTDPPATQTLTPEEAADVIFFNGTVLTMENSGPVTAVAVKDGQILTLGNDDRILQLQGPETHLVDLAGLTLMPGFVDTHNHSFNTADVDYAAMQQENLANGITTMGAIVFEPDIMAEMRRLDETGGLRMRISAYPVHVDNCGEVLGPWYAEEFPVSREPGAMFQISGVKMFNDGGSCNAPAVSYEYPSGIGNGDLYFAPEELALLIDDVQAMGYQAIIHSLGDRAVQSTQLAIERVLSGGENVYRHRIEHNAVLRPELMPRYSEIGIVPVIFGAFDACFWAGDTSSFRFVTPEESRDMEWAWRPLIDQNPDLPFAWHSDYPVFSLNPFEHLYGMVTRQKIAADGSVCMPPDWAADDVLTVDEGLRMMTVNAAYALFREDDIGSLRIGKLADMIVVSSNPYETDPAELYAINVLMTMVGGQVEHCAEDSLCP